MAAAPAVPAAELHPAMNDAPAPASARRARSARAARAPVSAAAEPRPPQRTRSAARRAVPSLSAFQVRLVLSILESVLVRRIPLDRSYAHWFARVHLDPQEQGFVVRQINAMLSHLSFYAHAAGLRHPGDLRRHLTRLVICYAAHRKLALPELDGGAGFDRRGIPRRIREAEEDVLLREGCPAWLNEVAQQQLGAAWPEQRAVLACEAPRCIRTNTLKITRDQLARVLSEQGIVSRALSGHPEALEITSASALFRSEAYRAGYFEQQDAGSQAVARFVEAAPGMRVIDACAGSGGKTLHLAALMQARGTLIALDDTAWKLDELRVRARRAGASNIEARLCSSTKVLKRLHGSADRVLLDAPCSGVGMFRRIPDLKWTDARDRLAPLQQQQQELLRRCAPLVRGGGALIYSTCSFLPSENTAQIGCFLESCQGRFELEEERQILPSSGCDGFYMARLRCRT